MHRFHKLFLIVAMIGLLTAIVDATLQARNIQLHLGIVGLTIATIACFVELFRVLLKGSESLEELSQQLQRSDAQFLDTLGRVETKIARVRDNTALLRRATRTSKGTTFENWLWFINRVMDNAESHLFSVRARHAVGLIHPEGRYFTELKRKVHQQDLHHRRLISLRTMLSFDHAKNLLHEFSDANRFEMRAWTGEVFPLTCEVVLSESMVALGFCQSNDNVPRSCWLIEDHDFAVDMLGLYNSLWDDRLALRVREAGQTGIGAVDRAIGRLTEARFKTPGNDAGPQPTSQFDD